LFTKKISQHFFLFSDSDLLYRSRVDRTSCLQKKCPNISYYFPTAIDSTGVELIDAPVYKKNFPTSVLIFRQRSTWEILFLQTGASVTGIDYLKRISQHSFLFSDSDELGKFSFSKQELR
jgi:hypothetical protein